MTSTSQKTGRTSRAQTSARPIGTSATTHNARAVLDAGRDSQCRNTEIEKCVQQELRRYFDLLDGENPVNLYRMVVKQAEHAVIEMVMQECRGNQSRASEWLGISRGNLRTKLANMDKKGA